ncbi:MAG: hypothetical protein Q9227_009063 [Pyrenula ochraceoflavens]
MNTASEPLDRFTSTNDKALDPLTIETQDPHGAIRDDTALSRLGKKQVLKVDVFNRPLSNGGPAGVIYGFLVVWVGTLSTFVTISELTSMAPTSGGQYHWVAMLAPQSCQRFLSYITGWLTVLGWQAVVASGGLLSGTTIQGLIILCDSSYTPQNWHGTLLLWAAVIFSGCVNSFMTDFLAKFEGFILIVHVVGFFAILIPLVYLGPHDSAHNVFTQFLNEGGWPSQGTSFWVGIVGNVFAFFGADAAVHMSEEIQDAQLVVPRSILTSIIINGSLGFAMALAIMFCIGDVNNAINTPTQYPFMEIFQQAVKSTPGAAIMSSIIIAMTVCATVGCVASASRLLWSFCRDRAAPGWRTLEKVHPRTLIPFPAVATTVFTACLLSLINIGSPAAFNQVISLTVGSIFASYLIATSLFLWRRCRGDILTDTPNTSSSTSPSAILVNVPGAPLKWGPWRLKGWVGIANNVFSCAYITIIMFWSFWPPVKEVDAKTMNYSCLMLGGAMAWSVVYYVVWARGAYKGPVVETGQQVVVE